MIYTLSNMAFGELAFGLTGDSSHYRDGMIRTAYKGEDEKRGEGS